LNKIISLKVRFASVLDHKVITNIKGLLKNSPSYSSEMELITKEELIDKLASSTGNEANKADKMLKLIDETERLIKNRKTRQLRR
jgi:hypothetical protein